MSGDYKLNKSYVISTKEYGGTYLVRANEYEGKDKRVWSISMLPDSSVPDEIRLAVFPKSLGIQTFSVPIDADIESILRALAEQLIETINTVRKARADMEHLVAKIKKENQ